MLVIGVTMGVIILNVIVLVYIKVAQKKKFEERIRRKYGGYDGYKFINILLTEGDGEINIRGNYGEEYTIKKTHSRLIYGESKFFDLTIFSVLELYEGDKKIGEDWLKHSNEGWIGDIRYTSMLDEHIEKIRNLNGSIIIEKYLKRKYKEFLLIKKIEILGWKEIDVSVSKERKRILYEGLFKG